MGVVVDDVDVSLRADHLEAAGDAREPREQARHGRRIEAELERHQRCGGGVLEVVQAGLREIQGEIAAGVAQHAPGTPRPDGGDPQSRVGVGR